MKIIFSLVLKAALVSCIGLSACSILRQISDASLPEQYVIASVDGNFSRGNAFVRIHRSASDNLKTWSSTALFTSSSGPNVDLDHGGPTFQTTIFGRGGSSPGIASNGKFYVMAFWGRDSRVALDTFTVTMYVSLSHDGVAWTVPTPAHTSGGVHSNFSGVVGKSGISVAHAANGSWFATYADETGVINIVPLPVRANGEIDQLIDTTPVTISGATTNRSPALSSHNGSLVLAWRVPGSSGGLRLISTQDGRSWPQATAATTPTLAGGTASPSSLTIEDSAPFLHSSGNTLFLTSTAFLPSTTGAGNAGRVNLYSSTDGASFTLVKAFPITDPLYEGASAAGPAPTGFAVVYPTTLRSSTTAFTSALAERTIPTNTNRRVTIAGGPGQ